jgi:hypothetical protein
LNLLLSIAAVAQEIRVITFHPLHNTGNNVKL